MEVTVDPESPLQVVVTEVFHEYDFAECRLCAQESVEKIGIFSQAGKERGLSQKVKQCLPIVISEDDELPKSICIECCDKLDEVFAFFEMCINATQELVILLRKNRTNAIELTTHVNQYVRSFNPPTVPRFKVKVIKYVDQDPEENVNDELGSDGEYDKSAEEDLGTDDIEKMETIVEVPEKSEGLEFQEDGFVTSYVVSMDDLKKLPKVPRRRKSNLPRKYNPDGTPFDPFFDDPGSALEKRPARKEIASRGRKKLVPRALKTCSECGEEFQSQASNLAHWQSHHPDKEVVYTCRENDDVTEELCGFSSSLDRDIYQHRSKHKTRTQDKDVECKICGKFYSRYYLINQHMSLHSKERNFNCPICGKDFKTAIYLKSHLNVHQPEEVKYIHCCDQCGKRFAHRANLEAHLRVHTGLKPFPCDICGKSFSHKGNMEEHRRVHTGERPFVCELCGAAFKRGGEMKMHLRVAHTGDRPYKCSFCVKTFQYSNLLKRHELIHKGIKPYPCPHCGKAFTQRDKMQVHTRLHTGERPYVCEVCSKGFCESGNLRKHMKVHGKEPPPIVHQNNKGKPAPT